MMETVSWTAHDSRKTYYVALMTTDSAWRPAAWNDAPPAGIVQEVVACCATRAEAEGWVFGFNTSAVDDHTGWAVILKRKTGPQPGRRYVQRYPVFMEAADPTFS